MIVYCPCCDMPMHVLSCAPLTCYCHVCALKVIFTFSLSSSTTALTLSAKLPRSWEDPPTKTIIPRVFYEAFEGDEEVEV